MIHFNRYFVVGNYIKHDRMNGVVIDFVAISERANCSDNVGAKSICVMPQHRLFRSNPTGIDISIVVLNSVVCSIVESLKAERLF